MNWLYELLNSRSQSVLINNTLSNPLKIHSELPQGGVIGPLRFLIYINDITLNTHIQSEVSLFADGAKVFSKSENSLQLTLDNIHEWLKTRRFDLNQKKSQVLSINKNKSFPINLLINKTKIPAVKFFKDLGIYIHLKI